MSRDTEKPPREFGCLECKKWCDVPGHMNWTPWQSVPEYLNQITHLTEQVERLKSELIGSLALIEGQAEHIECLKEERDRLIKERDSYEYDKTNTQLREEMEQVKKERDEAIQKSNIFTVVSVNGEDWQFVVAERDRLRSDLTIAVEALERLDTGYNKTVVREALSKITKQDKGV